MYTNSDKADLVVEKELDIVKKIIISEIPGIYSIVLFGSFGQGEGSYVKEKGRIELIGDYDIYVITKKHINENVLRKVSVLCSNAIGKGGLDIVEDLKEEYDKKKFFHIDIRAIPYWRLKNLLPTLRTFDLKQSKVIFGRDFLNLIPDVKISLSEALRLLFNQANYLLVCEDKPKEAELIYSMKVIQNCCSALLIAKGKYDSSYKKRNEIFQGMDFPIWIKEKVDLSTKFKLKTSFNFNEDKIWRNAKNCLEYSIKYLLKEMTGKEFRNWREIAYVISEELPYSYFQPYLPSKYLFPAQYYLNIKFVENSFRWKERIIKPVFYWKDVGLKIASALLLYIYNEKILAEHYVKKITNRKGILKEQVLNLFTYYYSQKLI